MQAMSNQPRPTAVPTQQHDERGDEQQPVHHRPIPQPPPIIAEPQWHVTAKGTATNAIVPVLHRPKLIAISPPDAPTGIAPGGPAANNGPPKGTKRARTSKPKVKTGCSTCKERRIKCDETRPSCLRCLKQNRTCPGYPPPARLVRPFGEVRIAPKPVPVAVVATATATTTTCRPLCPRRAQKVLRRSLPAKEMAATPPQTPQLGGALVRYSSVPGLRLSHTEGLYFQLFQVHTAGELSRHFDDVFWTNMVLPECHVEDSIRHAVIALGALYKTLEATSDSPPNSPSRNNNGVVATPGIEHWRVAMEQYGLACKATIALSGQDRRQHRTGLMASVLLACFDSFIGDHESAISNIQGGLRLLERMREELRQNFLPPTQEPVEEELVQMFNRLAIQAKSYDMAFHFAEPYVIRLSPGGKRDAGFRRDPYSPPAEAGDPLPQPPQLPQPPLPPLPLPFSMLPPPPPIPSRFTSLREARLAWDKLCERLLRFIEILMDSNTPSDRPRGILPPEIIHIGKQFKDHLGAWSRAFDPLLFGRNAPGVGWLEKAGIAILKMNKVMGDILYVMTFSDSELQFDGYRSQFAAIVELGAEVVADEERHAAAKRCPELLAGPAPSWCRHQVPHGAWSHPSGSAFGSQYQFQHQFQHRAHHVKPSFSADLGIVPPLYVVATKCRDRLLRRRAIQLLLSSDRREGMWDSGLSARIGSWVTEVEEGGESPFEPDPAVVYDDCSDVLSPRWRLRAPVPEERRVMVKSVSFDLQKRWVEIQVGTRCKTAVASDHRRREARIVW